MRSDGRRRSPGVRTCLGGPHVRRRVEGDDADVIFELLQQLVELLLTAAAVGEDLHLVGDAPRHPRLDVLQVHSPLLQEEGEGEGEGEGRGGEDSAVAMKESDDV